MRPLYVALLASLALSACGPLPPANDTLPAATVASQPDAAAQAEAQRRARFDATFGAGTYDKTKQMDKDAANWQALFNYCVGRAPIPVSEWQDGEIKRRCAAQADRTIYPGRAIAR